MLVAHVCDQQHLEVASGAGTMALSPQPNINSNTYGDTEPCWQKKTENLQFILFKFSRLNWPLIL